MQTTTKPSTTKAWAKAIAQPATEFSPTPLPVIAGEIPSNLRGTLYRNGPARLERGRMRMGHWFDGDGAILAIHFNSPLSKGGEGGSHSPVSKGGEGGSAIASYRYVQTAGYQKEAIANRLLYGNYGMTAPGAFWNRWLKPIKNVANTSVLPLPDKLLALWEGGKPHALDLQTLETKGEDDLSGLSNGLPYSAHYKRDPHTGEIFNFGISPGINAKLNLYKSDRTGKILQKATFTLDGVPIVHDFVLAGQYLVFFVPSVRVNALPVLLGLSCYSDAIEWQPQLGTQFLIFDRETLTLVSRGETEPWYQWHFANGYVDPSGTIVVDLVRYEDFQTNQYLKEVATGQTHTPAPSSLSRVHLNPKLGKVTAIEQILDRSCEFPIGLPHLIGQAASPTFLSVHRSGVNIGAELFGAIAKFDSQTQSLTVADFGENCYPMEPIFAPDPQNSASGWIVTVVYDGNRDRSEVWIFDSDRLDAPPVCKLELPSVVPMGFHGAWRQA
ncbi:carotenoid oxygenase family protein [Chroococcidiopsis sp.]|uniref:carotenoid oxygenase family protein n=1 Tax=Chroococcidiopsis sp. TaxID=3088168 RepID=UPI003F2AFDEB